MSEEQLPPLPEGRSTALWAGVLGAPAVLALQFETKYAMSHWVCVKQAQPVLHLMTIIALILLAVALYLSWRDWKFAGGGSPDEPEGGPRGRTRFLGGLGMTFSIYCAIFILAQDIASFFYDGCWT